VVLLADTKVVGLGGIGFLGWEKAGMLALFWYHNLKYHFILSLYKISFVAWLSISEQTSLLTCPSNKFPNSANPRGASNIKYHYSPLHTPTT
jgi:hypothetical protein